MIPINEIRAWSKVVLWINDELIEQGLVICRSLIETFLRIKPIMFFKNNWYRERTKRIEETLELLKCIIFRNNA